MSERKCFVTRRQATATVLAATLLISIWGLAACGPGKMPAEGLQPMPGIKSVAIIPFVDMAQVYGRNQSVRSPITGKVFVSGAVAANATGLFDTLTLQKITDAGDLAVISPSIVRGKLELLMSGDGISLSERKKVIALGRRTGADAVIAGYVYRFEEREGTAYAAEKPASVAFDLHMVRVADGRVLWSGYFNETQKPLTENLFELDSFVKRGAKWVTARDMATEAMEEMLSANHKTR